MNDFLQFRMMVTPTIIQVIFIVGSALLILAGLITAFGAVMEGRLAGVFIGPIVAVLGPLALRVYCEVLIVVFKIHEAVERVADERKLTVAS